MWLADKRERRREQDHKEEERRQQTADNLAMLVGLSETMHDQVERLEEVTDRLEGALNE